MSPLKAKAPNSNPTAGRPASFTRQDVLVSFHVDEAGHGVFEYSTGGGPRQPTLSLDVDSDQAMLAFYLDPMASPDTVFPQNPFTWVTRHEDGSLEPLAKPGNFFCFAEKFSCAIQDTNPMPSLQKLPSGAQLFGQTFHFFISVLYKDRVYTSADPTIINKIPPDGPGSGG